MPGSEVGDGHTSEVCLGKLWPVLVQLDQIGEEILAWVEIRLWLQRRIDAPFEFNVYFLSVDFLA